MRIHSKRFSQVIKKNGIKVEDLAASIVTPGKGINNQAKAEAAIRNWMRGSDHPRATAEHIKKLAAALGVAPASIAKFTALYRFERGSNTGGIGGTGLGLHIVRELMHKHGGEVTFESAEGVGTTFRIELPKAPVRAPQSPTRGVALAGDR